MELGWGGIHERRLAHWVCPSCIPRGRFQAPWQVGRLSLRGRLMGSRLFETDLLTGHEPENRKSLEINEAILRFMESHLFEIDRLTDHEPGREHRWLSIPKGLRPKARGCEERATPG